MTTHRLPITTDPLVDAPTQAECHGHAPTGPFWCPKCAPMTYAKKQAKHRAGVVEVAS